MSQKSASRIASISEENPDVLECIRIIAETVKDVLWLSTPEGKILYVSPAYGKIWGHDCRHRGDISQCFFHCIHPDDRERVKKQIEEHAGEGWECEYRIVLHDGKTRWVRHRGFPYRGKDSACLLLTGIATDITESKIAEQAMLESEARLQSIIDSSPALIFLKDLEGRYTQINKQCERVFGLKNEDVLGKSPFEVFPADIAEPFASNDRNVLESLSPIEAEETLPGAYGSRVLLTVQFPLKDSSGAPCGTCGIATDITERKRFEEALRQSEAKLQAIVATAADAIINIDTRGIIQSCNPSAEQIFGYRAEEMIGSNVGMLMPPKYRESHEKAMTQYVSGERKTILCPGRDAQALRKDGSAFPVEIAVSEVTFDDQRLFTGILRDISERKAAQEKIEAAFQALEEANNHLLAIMNLLDLAIISIDYRRRVSFINLKAQAILGQESGRMVGRPWNAVLPLKPEDQVYLESMMGMPVQDRRVARAQVELKKRGSYWFDISIKDDPSDPERKILILRDVTEIRELRNLLDKAYRFQEMVGKSPVMQQVFQRIQEVSQVDWTVLIEGETGTGKELAARAIHSLSHRKNGPFVALNCAGLTDSLLVSQLFGHKRGAFSGAVSDQKGFFEVADGGTLFLDEIGDISAAAQTSLLRVLEDGQITRLGESTPRRVDVRILAASNRNLSALAERGTFRLDLLYRLKIGRIELPPLRERREDIPLLCEAFLKQSCAAAAKAVHGFSDHVRQVFLEYAWPGNVRELKSAIDFAVLHCKRDIIQWKDLPPEIRFPRQPSGASSGETLPDEKELLLTALARARGNRTRAARELGMSRSTLYRRLAAFGGSGPLKWDHRLRYNLRSRKGVNDGEATEIHKAIQGQGGAGGDQGATAGSRAGERI